MAEKDRTTIAEDIHGVANPSDVRETDSVFARIRESGTTNDYSQIRVWRLSPLGVELVDSDTNDTDLSKGKSIDLQIVVEGRRSEMSGKVVSTRNSKHGDICGLRFLSENSHHRSPDKYNRTAMRWLCSEHHLPSCLLYTSPSPRDS